jgi:hypothetical protein
MKVNKKSLVWCAIAVMWSGAVVASVLGCGGALCEVPEGTYDLKVVESTGDCPQDIADAIKEGIEEGPLVIESPENACGDVAVTTSDFNEASMCTISVSGFADGTEDGISDFEMTLALSGSDCSLACNQTMQIKTTKR